MPWSPWLRLWIEPLFLVRLKQGLQTFRSKATNYYTTFREPDILRNSFGICYTLPNQVFVKILSFHYWQIVFEDRIWPVGRSLETLSLKDDAGVGCRITNPFMKGIHKLSRKYWVNFDRSLDRRCRNLFWKYEGRIIRPTFISKRVIR